MSIWATSLDFSGETEHDDSAPIAYLGSHIMPTLADLRSGSLDLGLIPGFVTQDGWCVHGVDHTQDGWTDFDHAETCEPLDELPAVWPYLRVALTMDAHNRVAVILDRSQVEKLRDALSGWLDRAVTG